MYFVEEKKDGEGKGGKYKEEKMFPLRDKRTTTNKERQGYSAKEWRVEG